MGLLDRVLNWWRARRSPEDLDLGLRGEMAAERYLKKLGHRVVARRHRSRFGELDLITMDRSTLVFVEVKTRRTSHCGHPEAAISLDKQRRLSRAAAAYLKRRRSPIDRARFDVVAITWPSDDTEPNIVHYQDAFDAVGEV